eukprot:GILJ01004852.1.p1 GENE.GILJ01004852.1~~GILJ01004852.1.p1  ORF type:complete len:656 (+),score=83.86 GILJ01004852.1:104-2071(+)
MEEVLKAESFAPLAPISERAHVKNMQQYQELYNSSIQNPDAFWDEQAKTLRWMRPFTTVRQGSFQDADIAWFLNGQLNICDNCVDRHVPTRGDQVAIIWEGDKPDESQSITYKQLLGNVCRVANMLKRYGVRKGDTVAIYMPTCPEAAYAMLACTRIGAPHSVVFAGFSAESLYERINNGNSRFVITCDGATRGGKTIALKSTVDEAILHCPQVEKVFMFEKTGSRVTLDDNRDIIANTAMQLERPYCPCEPMDAEDIMFLLYTSGSTGKPKGIAHTHAGYLLYASLTHKYVFDYHPGDVYACVADIGWITGHSYILYGPLANGATTVMFESVPTYPDNSRYWHLVEKHKINIFYTAPTAIRALMRFGDEPVRKYDRSSLRVLGSVGEPINPEAWRWYHQVVGEGRCAVVDTYWQTETGGIVISPLPGCTPTKPGSATLPFFGIEPVVLDAHTGHVVEGNSVSGVLALKSTWPGITRTIFGDHPRFIQTYLQQYRGYYFTGDGCFRDQDGYYWITGRVDDVMNVAGHRIGSAEVEHALVQHHAVAEAACVGYPHDIKGQGLFCYVILKESVPESIEMIQELKNCVRMHIGPIATPDVILIAPTLPKTRSGKIMRRILRKIAANEIDTLGDISTLADPTAVEVLIKKAHALLIHKA